MTEVLPEAFPGFTWAWLQLGPGYWGWAQVGPAMSFTESSLSLAVSELAPMVDAAEVVPAVESIAAESAGLVGLSVSGGVLAVAGVMAVGAAFVVGGECSFQATLAHCSTIADDESPKPYLVKSA